MKQILFIMTAILVMGFHFSSATAQSIPTGMRIEMASHEDDDEEFEIFAYKDQDGTFGYYLSLGQITKLMDIIIDPQFTNTSFDDIKETCLCLGATPEEAFATIDSLLELYDKEVGTTVEFPCRASLGVNKLGAADTTTCVVKKKPLGGKRLQFLFTCGNRRAESYLYKSVLKSLRQEFRRSERKNK